MELRGFRGGKERAGDTRCVQNLEWAFSYIKKDHLNIIKEIEQFLFLLKVAVSTDGGLCSLAHTRACVCGCMRVHVCHKGFFYYVFGWCQVHLPKPWCVGKAALMWAALAQSPGTVDEERRQHFSNNKLAAEGRRQSPKWALWER